MEKEQELKKLMRVLHRLADAGRVAGWHRVAPDAVRFCVAQYNKTLARIHELEPATVSVFAPLGDDATLNTAQLAARELVAYLADEEPPRHQRHRRPHFGGCRPRIVVGAIPVGGRCR